MTPTLYLAPLRGFTNAVYRNIFSRFFDGFDLAVAPFISTTESIRLRDRHVRDLLPEHNLRMPVIPQLIGNSPEEFIRMTRRLSDLGYDAFNWNLGCPFPMVAKKQRGSGLLPHPDRIDAFLSKVVPDIPGTLSIKARLGRFSNEEIFRLIPVFNRYPLAEVILHPRTGVQMYEGVPDIDVFERCLEALRPPVAYNGDITRLSDFTRLSERFPTVDRWMIGRGALINPFLAASIKSGNDDFPDRIGTFHRFHDALFSAYREVYSGPAHLVDGMKGFWFYFSQAFEDTHKLVKEIRRVRCPEHYLARVTRFFEAEAVWRNPAPDPA
ncbi:tRNA dihydrouridine synthase [Desulfococcus sp.]|uniref:tRNA dihydrouridine synthase n=1 Tax=Desulfococcus sp. TaxID=2025834 RepID=UPI003594795E